MTSLSASKTSLIWARVLRLMVPWLMAGASALCCGAAVGYAPNALGLPTQLGAYASAVSHQPNGAIAGYTNDVRR